MPIAKVKKYFQNGAKGIKMHNGIQGFSADDDGLKEIYNYCSENHIPVTFHCGETSRVHMNELTDIENLIPVVRKYPDIPFVLTHLAAGEPDMVERIAELCPNVLFDISIAFSGEHCIHRIHNDIWEDNTKASEMFKKIGCDRFAFGSDYPFGNPVSDILRIKNLNLSDYEKEMILGKNTESLYF